MKGLKPGKVPLERALSKLGLASRGVARQWILDGRVKVAGIARRDPSYPVSPERSVIEVDGERAVRAETRVFMLHKPRGTVTTRSDEKGRPTVFELVEPLSLHLIAVGRLDWATSGLLLLTNDTRIADWLTDPAHRVRRSYLVTVRGEVTAASIATLERGVVDDGELLRADEIELRKSSSRESHLTVHLSGGKNREIRRLFKSAGHEVSRLKRVAYGPLELGELKAGTTREIGLNELRSAFPDLPISSKPSASAR